MNRLYLIFCICFLSLSMLLKAYAKVNLFLEIVARRDDGYHDLVTILQTINLYDTIRLTIQPKKINLTCNIPELPIDSCNLAYRAASLLQEKTGVKQGISIHLEKNIPIGAGLGGGSSDAAAVLIGCNKLWNCNLSYDELTEIGCQLGMDVPFFLRGGTALALGKGERIVRQLPTPELVFVVVYPNFPISTATVYKHFNIASIINKKDPTEIISAIETNNCSKIACLLFNRLEITTFNLYPKLVEVKQKLVRLGCVNVLMTGSGSAIFGIASEKSQGERIVQKIDKEQQWWVKLVETVKQYNV
ncbi:MAG: 4-(cytidine 5'-diphospho)-2-C-methyl-D-erythritol kinase [bacterium]|nr:4-(cytidine 5'-diphospho)-2-C-methyl-D-erythritol kinase [bacterium]